MKAFYKGNITDGELIISPSSNRAFLYGDGLFETMIAHNGSVKFLDEHIIRMSDGLSFLKINPPDELNINSLSRIIKELHHNNQSPEFAKIKMISWRSEGGTYSPLNNSSECFISLDAIQKPPTRELIKVSFSKNTKNVFSNLSRFKSINALNYVIAGMELTSRGLEDIIIPDQNGYISECLVSNIFWVKENCIYTPSLKTGCIAGVARKIILRESVKYDINCIETECLPKEFLQAESVFTANASGLSHILKIDQTAFTKFGLIEKIYRPY